MFWWWRSTTTLSLHVSPIASTSSQMSSGFCTAFSCAYFITARISYASAVLGIQILSVRMSVTRVLCDKTKEHTAEIFTSHERVINRVFWYQKRLAGDVRFHLKFALKVTHPPLKNANFDQYLLITSETWQLAKNVQLSRIRYTFINNSDISETIFAIFGRKTLDIHCVSKNVPTYFLLYVGHMWTDFSKDW